MPAIRVLTVSGSPYALGYSHGQACAQAPEAAVARLNSSARVCRNFMVLGRWGVIFSDV